MMSFRVKVKKIMIIVPILFFYAIIFMEFQSDGHFLAKNSVIMH